MDLYVVDASVLVELVVDGRHREGADALLERYEAQSDVTLVTAAHGLVEATSALRRLVLRGALDPASGERAVTWLGALGLVLDATEPRLRRVWSLRDTMSAYDAAYAAAAEALGVPLLSTDDRLLRACDAAGIEAQHLSSLSP